MAGGAASLKRPLYPSSGDVSALSFGFYTTAEVRATSVVRVTHGVLFDASGSTPLENGLYDGRMGPIDRRQGLCATCGLSFAHCPGHCGHVELPMPVYHPLGFNTAKKLLSATCFHCFRLRVPEQKTKALSNRLELLRDGKIVEAEIMGDDQYAGTVLGDRRAAAALGLDGSDERRQQNCTDTPVGASKLPRWSTHSLELAATTSDEMFAAVPPSTCANCGAHNAKISLRGQFKLFVQKLSDKKMNANIAGNRVLRSALAQEQVEQPEGNQRQQQQQQPQPPPAPPSSGAALTANDLGLGSDSDSDSDSEAEEAGAQDMIQTGDDDDDDDDDDDGDESGLLRSSSERLMTAEEARAALRLLWRREKRILSNLFACLQLNMEPGQTSGTSARFTGSGPDSFFLTHFLVPPNRFRPPSVLGDSVFEHPLNSAYVRILNAAERAAGAGLDEGSTEEEFKLSRYATAALELQDAVAALMDSTTTRNKSDNAVGVRQLLEKKEGVFRKNMMGKRVNFAARSVISPDPYLAPDEIGVPPPLASGLLFPETVTPHNVHILREAVMNGKTGILPGAAAVEDSNGKVVDLSRLDTTARVALAKLLASGTGTNKDGVVGARPKVVYRTLMDGDILLVNRQPSLHRPSIMAHRARLLNGERTIRMHYSNCSQYNADFDGDEMNLHLPQDSMARSEAYNVANADLQYHLPTDGGPKRGLIQDHIIALVKLTSRGTASLTKEEVTQMLFFALDAGSTADRAAVSRAGGKNAHAQGQNLSITALTKGRKRRGQGVVHQFKEDRKRRIDLPPPALVVRSPSGGWCARWTGKQVVESLIANVVRRHLPPGDSNESRARVTFSHGCKVKHEAWPGGTISDGVGDGKCLFEDGVFVHGVLDKNTFGGGGLIQYLHEYYSPAVAGAMLGSFSRLGTYLVANKYGFTCGVSDLWLNGNAEKARATALAEADASCISASSTFVGSVASATSGGAEVVRQSVASRLRARPELGAALDTKCSSSLGGVTSAAMKCASISGKSSEGSYLDPLHKSNGMSQMTSTGAKGGMVNQLQISVCLGQQELEGRRVPRNMLGKTLPCFTPFDVSAVSGGYIASRFLTGLDPREFYFHCMAGRDGLVDTTVKTSRSGYLQRCLVKSLEGLRVRYDHTVRDDVGDGIVQFLYGDDGIDVSKVGLRTFQPECVYANRTLAARVCGMESQDLVADVCGDGADDNDDGSDKKKKKRKSRGTATLPSDPEAAMHAAKRAIADATLDAVCADSEQPPLPLTATDPAPAPGVTSEWHRQLVRDFVSSNPSLFATSKEAEKVAKAARKADKKLKKKLGVEAEDPDATDAKPSADGFARLCEKLYTLALADPGEAVGVIAAQSIGEPSTQMTLNTFHFAGRGEANVTLGVPRLRELLMTASDHISTPVLTIPIRNDVLCEKMSSGALPRLTVNSAAVTALKPDEQSDNSRRLAELLASRLRRVSVAEVIKEISVTERVGAEHPTEHGRHVRTFEVHLLLHSLDSLHSSSGLTVKRSDIEHAIGKQFLKELSRVVKAEARKLGTDGPASDIFGGEALGDLDAPLPPAPPAADADAEANEGNGDDDAAAATQPRDSTGGQNAPPAATARLASHRRRVSFADDPKDLATHMEDEEDEAAEQARGRGGRRELASYDDGDANDDPAELEGERTMMDVDGSEDDVYDVSAFGLRVRHVFQGNNKPSKHVVTLHMPCTGRKLLLLELAELAATRALVRSPTESPDVKTNLGRCYVVENPKQRGSYMLQVDGNDFVHAAYLHTDIVDISAVRCNDVAAVLNTFGVEAARRTVVEEIGSVFGAYGIKVDPRHLSLIGDAMTHGGGYRGFSRMGMAPNGSPLLKMSFESAGKFLTEAAVHGRCDRLDGPSARLVLGKIVEAGTGECELLQKL